MSDISSNCCPYCNESKPCDFTMECGHPVHLSCLGKRFIDEQKSEHKCFVCESSLNDLSPYWDILRESGMNKSEEFYLNLSGNTVLSGLAKYLMDNMTCPLERFLERTYSMYNNIETLFPNMNAVFENALTTGDRRIVQFLLHCQMIFLLKLGIMTGWN